MRHTRQHPRESERGSATVVVIGLATVLFLMIGLVIDGGGAMQTRDDARWIAQQAARAAGQHLDVTPLLDGNTPTVSLDVAAAAARAYLDAAGVSGTISQTPDGVQVTVTTIYHTKIVQLFGMKELEQTATATARIARGVPVGGF
jgi:Flp pilus assembly protein TadG